MTLTPEALDVARALVAERVGFDFPENRRAVLEQRLVRASRGARMAPREYIALLASSGPDSPEWKRFIEALTVGETYFFRDRDVFRALNRDVLPELIERRRREGTRRLRIWSAGCSTGEEPFSIAMLLDALLPDRHAWSITILGTDVDERALETARHGRFRPWSLRDTPADVRERYFTSTRDRRLELSDEIRRMVSFARLNLVESDYPSAATNTIAHDLVLCRNVLMYLTTDAQRAVRTRLADAVLEGGWLLVSAAEAAARLFTPLEPVSSAGAVLFRKPRVAGARPAALSARATARAAPERPAVPPPRPQLPPPPTNPVTLALARAEANAGNLHAARELCRRAVAENPLDVDAYVLLASIEQERGDPDAAAAAARNAIYVKPDSAPAHFLLGSALLRRGERAKARASMETVVALLASAPDGATVGDGISAARLLQTATAFLAAA